MNRFLILLGVSGVGKSSLIKELQLRDPRFEYIRPFTTRPLRTNETEKLHISESKAKKIISSGDYLIRNKLYGHEYITPKQPIYLALQQGQFPLLDFPLHRLVELKKAFGGDLFTVYVSPPSIEVWKKRLSDGRDIDNSRLTAGLRELCLVEQSEFQVFDLAVMNDSGCLSACAETIYDAYLNACGAVRIDEIIR